MANGLIKMAYLLLLPLPSLGPSLGCVGDVEKGGEPSIVDTTENDDAESGNIEENEPLDGSDAHGTGEAKAANNKVAGAVCDVYLSTSGSDSNSGSTKEEPKKSVSSAASSSEEGKTLCFMGGDYAAIALDGLAGTETKPWVLKPAPGHEGEVRIKGKDVAHQFGVRITNSSFVFVEGFKVENLQKGISFASVTHGGIYDNEVTNIGMEALHVGAEYDFNAKEFVGKESSNVDVVGNTVRTTGLLFKDGRRHPHAEGIYIGTGSKGGDKTHDILVQDNVLEDISAEAIELKPHTYNVKVIGNQIKDVLLSYSAAITVAVGINPARNGNYLIKNNTIQDVKTDRGSIGGIVIAHGDTVVDGNRVSNVEGGRGIRVYTIFSNEDANKVSIQNNTVDGTIALNDGDGGFKNGDFVLADITTENNEENFQ